MSESTDKIRNAKRIVWFCVLGIVAALATFAFIAFQLSTASKIERQEKYDPCVSLSEAVLNQNVDRIPALTKGCKGFLSSLGPLVTIRLSCAIIEKARYVCPAPGSMPSRQSSGAVLGPTLPTVAGADPATGGGASEPGDDGGSGPVNPGSDPDDPSPGKGGSGDPQGPGQGGGAPDQPQPPASSPPVSSPVPTPTPSPPSPEPASAPIKEAVGGVVEEVGGIVCGVTGALNLPCR